MNPERITTRPDVCTGKACVRDRCRVCWVCSPQVRRASKSWKPTRISKTRISTQLSATPPTSTIRGCSRWPMTVLRE